MLWVLIETSNQNNGTLQSSQSLILLQNKIFLVLEFKNCKWVHSTAGNLNIIKRGNFIIEHWPITLILVILLYLLLLCCVKFLSYTNHYFLSGLTFKNTTTALLLSLVTFPTLKPSKWSEIWMKTRTHFQLWNPQNGSALMTQKVYIQDINPEKKLTHWQVFLNSAKRLY